MEAPQNSVSIPIWKNYSLLLETASTLFLQKKNLSFDPFLKEWKSLLVSTLGDNHIPSYLERVNRELTNFMNYNHLTSVLSCWDDPIVNRGFNLLKEVVNESSPLIFESLLDQFIEKSLLDCSKEELNTYELELEIPTENLSSEGFLTVGENKFKTFQFPNELYYVSFRYFGQRYWRNMKFIPESFKVKVPFLFYQWIEQRYNNTILPRISLNNFVKEEKQKNKPTTTISLSTNENSSTSQQQQSEEKKKSFYKSGIVESKDEPYLFYNPSKRNLKNKTNSQSKNVTTSTINSFEKKQSQNYSSPRPNYKRNSNLSIKKPIEELPITKFDKRLGTNVTLATLSVGPRKRF